MMDKKLTEKLNAAVSGKVLFDEPMSDHTSIGVGGKVDAFIYPGNSMDVVRAVTFLTEHGIPFLPVGNCTNLIVKDGGYRGCLISLRELQAIEITQEVDERAYLYAEAGVPLSRIVDISIRESLEGLEFCAGIPGTVGGGVRMNAGAYGMEMKDTVRSISLINGSAEAKKINKEDLHFEYRNLALPKGALITGAEFSLSKGRKEEIKGIVVGIINARREKHPLEYKSAGSVFKNPSLCPAGKIIDELGLKGLRSGEAMVSEMHGNFIVNLGRARAKDIISLIDMVRKKVLDEKGIELETEVRIIGEGI